MTLAQTPRNSAPVDEPRPAIEAEPAATTEIEPSATFTLTLTSTDRAAGAALTLTERSESAAEPRRRRPIWDSSALDAAIGPRRPATFDRAGRVRLIAQAARAMLDGRTPSAEARMFVGGALLAWLDRGGNLERRYLRVKARRGSHFTPAALWRRAHRDERREESDGAKSTAIEQTEPSK